MYVVIEIHFHVFIRLALDEMSGQLQFPPALPLGKEPGIGMDMVVTRKIGPFQESNCDSLVIQSIAQSLH
jgi:hypothetical protein